MPGTDPTNIRDLDGRVALITGGSRGIGREIVLELARRGASVVIDYFRNGPAAREVASIAEKAGVRALTVRAHVGELERIDDLMETVEREFGRLDILISNAATGRIRPVMDLDVKGWQYTLDINTRALLVLTQRAAPLMRRHSWGRVVALSSLGSSRVLPDYASIGVSKAGIEALVRYFAVELARDGITVNTVATSVVETDVLNFFGDRDGIVAEAVRRTPAGRIPTTRDIASTVGFLCSDGAAMINGQLLVVDGGYSLTV